MQDPVTLSDHSEPEPDISIARGPLSAFSGHPTPEDLVLVIEVADTTLAYDRGVKKLAYATAGIREYWIVNVYERQLEQFTEPDPAGGNYRKRAVFGRGQTITSPTLGSFAVEALTLPTT